MGGGGKYFLEASLDSKTNLYQIIKCQCKFYVFGQFGTQQYNVIGLMIYALQK